MTLDLTNCDREPIHIPGSIQSHGMLLAFDGRGVITRASENVKDFFSLDARDLLGRPVVDFISAEQIERLKERAAPELAIYREPVVFNIKENEPQARYDVHLHVDADESILELEPCFQEPGSFQSFYISVRQATVAILNSMTPLRCAEALAEQVQRLSGFDRVDVYKFDPEWNGKVIAEAKNKDVTPFLGQHFPASDIPQQARELYKRNFNRLIVDVEDPQSRLIGLTESLNQPLDLSFSVLRSVSPIHLQYLRNMEVKASMSISIMRRGELWGLVACHNMKSRFVDFHIRTVCESLAQIASSRIFDLEEAERYQSKIQARKTAQTLINQAADEKSFAEGLIQHQTNLLKLFSCSGALISIGGEINSVGLVPEPPFARKLIDWLERGQDSLFHCNDLPARMGLDENQTRYMAGILAIKILKSRRDWIVWFRPEYLQTVKWAGDPYKPVESTPFGERLYPRQSFQVFSQQVRGRSEHWHEWEIEAARDFRNSIADFVYLLEKVRSENLLRDLNLALEKKAQEVEEAKNLAQDASRLKSQFVANISHELRTPLNAVIGLADMLATDEVEPEVQETAGYINQSAQHLLSIVTELLDFSSLESRSYKNDEREFVVEEILNLAIAGSASHATSKGLDITLEIDSEMPQALVADGEKIQRIVEVFLSNAVKFSERGSIKISAAVRGGTLEIAVSDQGKGIREQDRKLIFQPFAQADGSYSREHEGLGLGLSIAERLVKLLRGEITFTSKEGEGSTFILTVPVGSI